MEIIKLEYSTKPIFISPYAVSNTRMCNKRNSKNNCVWIHIAIINKSHSFIRQVHRNFFNICAEFGMIRSKHRVIHLRYWLEHEWSLSNWVNICKINSGRKKNKTETNSTKTILFQ